MYRTIAVLITNLCFLSIFSSCKFSAHITLHFSLCFENQEKGKYISKGEQDRDTGPKYYFKSLLFSSSFSVSFNVLMVFILACFSTFNSFLLFEFTAMSFHEIGDKNCHNPSPSPSPKSKSRVQVEFKSKSKSRVQV